MSLNQLHSILQEPILETTRQHYRDKDRVATGDTLKTIMFDVVDGGVLGGSFQFCLGGGTPFFVQGRTPGAPLPPYEPIRRWVQARNGSTSRETVNQVRKSISRKGIQADEDFIPELNEKLDETIRREMSGIDAQKIISRIIFPNIPV